MRKSKKAYGRCRLTGLNGTFVSSHVIPKALTRASVPGRPFIQAGMGARPTRRFDSWFDTALVVRKGEDLLSQIDSRGVELLRRHKLVWSGWGEMKSIATDEPINEEAGFGFRLISGVDLSALRIFLISVLWRAAESSRPEFDEVDLPQEHREKLRQMIMDQDPQPLDWYNFMLTQIETRGPNHNQTPMALQMPMFNEEGDTEEKLPTIRFYFDGLVVNFLVPKFHEIPTTTDQAPMTTSDGELGVLVVQAEDSFQMRNYNKVISEAADVWPARLEALLRTSS